MAHDELANTCDNSTSNMPRREWSAMISFQYSRDRMKLEYAIRCDVESVNNDNLSPQFKSENCVSPRACVPKELYEGNRLTYEIECNQVGWSLAELNTCLRGKRGLIRRAVDGWRNSNQDTRLRSRRVLRLAVSQPPKTSSSPPMQGPTASRKVNSDQSSR
jgi:hypothetical protein